MIVTQEKSSPLEGLAKDLETLLERMRAAAGSTEESPSGERRKNRLSIEGEGEGDEPAGPAVSKTVAKKPQSLRNASYVAYAVPRVHQLDDEELAQLRGTARRVYAQLWKREVLTATELARQTGLTRKSVDNALSELRSKGFLRQVDLQR